MTDILVRRGRWEDAEFLALAILLATRSHLSRGWFDIALNRSESECLEFLRRLTTARARSQWHYSRFVVADVAARPVAALSAVRAADAYSMAPAAILESLKSCGIAAAERAAFWRRGAYLFTCTMRPADDSLTIEVAATVPECCGRGCAAALLAQALEDGRTQGLREVETTCFIGNTSAERTYLRAGFRFAGERSHPDFEAISGAPGIRRFVREL
jgi:GNAT superfamily N-acetyltransferase